MSQSTARRLAWSATALSIALVTVGLVLSVLSVVASDGEFGPPPHQFFNPLATLTFGIVGALIAVRQPRNPIGWLFIAVSWLSALTLLALGYEAADETFLAAASLPGLDVVRWVGIWVWIPPTVIPFTFLLLLFPDGTLLSPRWRPVAWAAGLGLAGVVVASGLHPGPLYDPPERGLNPLGIPGAAAALEIVLYVTGSLLVLSVVGSVVSMIVRFRRSSGVERQQLKWLTYAGVLVLVGFVLSGVVVGIWPDNPSTNEISIIITSLTTVGIVLATGVAILRYRLYDIDLLINRTLVYGALSTIVLVLYVLVVGGLGALFQARGSLSVSLVATGLVAAFFEPLRGRLQKGINRLMYGERDEPYAVLSRLGRRLEATLAPDAVLPIVVETVAQALKLPYVAVALKEGQGYRVATAIGEPVADPFILPLTYQAETIGQLICAPRGSNEPFGAAEQRLLEDVAHQAGVAVHAVQLTADLQRSRERLVTAREEERRRLRRDLHDGLGPALAAMALNVDTVRNLLVQAPNEADALLTGLKEQIQTSLADIRRLVYNLRPPALDDLGLVPALREQAAQYNQAEGLSTSIDAPESLPPLPAAVEVAAYRIALEALTNAVRHAQADRCRVQFSLPESSVLRLEITDNGVGLPSGVASGVGLTSMRERAEELGGALDIQPVAEGGTQVVARLPLPLPGVTDSE